MAGAVVSAAANWIGTQLVDEVDFLRDVDNQVRSLQQELKYIALHLREADSGEEGDDDQLRLFTAQIREIAFRAEDVVDDYILKVASSSSSTYVRGNFLKKFLCFLCSGPDIHSIGKETKAIRENIKEAVEQLNQFRNIHFSAPREGFNRPRPRGNVIQTYPQTEDANVVGRDEDVKHLVHHLTHNMEARVVVIVGAGGVGKTTLARMVYNDTRIKDHFKTAAWVTISQQWNGKDLLIEILRQTRGISYEEGNSKSERELVDAIYGFLSEKQYLLVLDDMWERGAWDRIYPAIAQKEPGSKVIITTRKEDLPSQVYGNCIIHKPGLLTEEQSWDLFKKIALENKDTPAAADDVALRLGREMTQKCGGLPLGVVTLAGLLRTKDTYEWERMSRRFNSILLKVHGPSQYGRSIYQALTLSYYDLPHYLKPCFLYLALFPEDDEIPAKRLTRMWVAEGFVTAQDEFVQENESVEDVAAQFLDELIQRCVVQVLKKSFLTGKVKTCCLHDLMRDFCLAKAEEQCFLRVLSSANQSNTTTGTSTQLRRASIVTSKVSLPTQCPHIRSLIQWREKELNLKIVCEDFKLLRVLTLYRVKTNDGYLPNELGNLRHLRYLSLLRSDINTLPESIGNLSNLLYLEYVAKCTSEREPLPNVLWKMKQLRHLYLDYPIPRSKELKLHTLTNLQTLWGLDVSYWESEVELEKLSPSLKKLRITGIRSQRLLDAVLRSPCMTSGYLVNLSLGWEDGVKLKSIEPLYKHCQHLRKLFLDGEIGEDCPLQFPPSLVKLILFCESENKLHDPMVATGTLSQLKYLYLSQVCIGIEMTCNAGSFPQLEELAINNFENLEEWRVEEGAMPRLKKLEINDCPKLKRLPEELKSIPSLQDLELVMPRSFCHRLVKQGDWIGYYEYQAGARVVAADDRGERGEDFHIIQRIPYVSFSITEAEL
ncbi:hypothetical protein Ancab_039554 [Ancistrocladus abbreviatus]